MIFERQIFRSALQGVAAAVVFAASGLLLADDSPSTASSAPASSSETFNALDVKAGKSAERNTEIMMIISKYLNSDEKANDPVVKKLIMDEVAKKMTLQPASPPDVKDFDDFMAVAKRLAGEKFTRTEDDLRAEAEKEADEKFKMYKLRDNVEVTYKKGPFTNTVSGKLTEVTARSIRIDSTYISLFDLSPESRTKFDPENNKTAKKNYVDEKVNEYENQKNDYAVQIFRALREKQDELNENNGYIYIWKEWRAPQYVVDVHLRQKAKEIEERKANEARLAAKAREDELRARGGGMPGGMMRGGDDTPTATTRTPSGTGFSPMWGGRQNPSTSGLGGGTSSSSMVSTGGTVRVRTFTAEEDARYLELSNEVEKRLNEIADNPEYAGIDTAQGYKKALWNMNRSDVMLLVTKDEPADASIKNAMNTDIIAHSSGMLKDAELHYINGVLVKVVEHYDIDFSNFNEFKNGLHEQYGRSDEEKENPRALDIRAPSTKKSNNPYESEDYLEMLRKLSMAEETKTEEVVTDVTKTFHWSGKNTTGKLDIVMNSGETKFISVTFTKECPSLIEELTNRTEK